MSTRFSAAILALAGASTLLMSPGAADAQTMRSDYVAQCVFILENFGSVDVSGTGVTPVAARRNAENNAIIIYQRKVVGYGGCLITP